MSGGALDKERCVYRSLSRMLHLEGVALPDRSVQSILRPTCLSFGQFLSKPALVEEANDNREDMAASTESAACIHEEGTIGAAATVPKFAAEAYENETVSSGTILSKSTTDPAVGRTMENELSRRPLEISNVASGECVLDILEHYVGEGGEVTSDECFRKCYILYRMVFIVCHLTVVLSNDN